MKTRLYLFAALLAAMGLTGPELVATWRSDPSLPLGGGCFALWLGGVLAASWANQPLCQSGWMVLLGGASVFLLGLAGGQNGLQALGILLLGTAMVTRAWMGAALLLLSLGWLPGLAGWLFTLVP